MAPCKVGAENRVEAERRLGACASNPTKAYTDCILEAANFVWELIYKVLQAVAGHTCGVLYTPFMRG